MMQAREGQGLENRAAVMRAESGRASAAAELAAIDEQIDLTRNAIAALIGEGPARGQAIALPGGGAARGLRPARRSRHRASSAAGRTSSPRGCAPRPGRRGSRPPRAEFYPNIRLSALIGLQALGIGNLLDGGSAYGSVGPAISLPIFSGGRIEGGYRGARADYDAAVARLRPDPDRRAEGRGRRRRQPARARCPPAREPRGAGRVRDAPTGCSRPAIAAASPPISTCWPPRTPQSSPPRRRRARGQRLHPRRRARPRPRRRLPSHPAQHKEPPP